MYIYVCMYIHIYIFVYIYIYVHLTHSTALTLSVDVESHAHDPSTCVEEALESIVLERSASHCYPSTVQQTNSQTWFAWPSRVGPYLSGKLQPGPGSAGARPWRHCNCIASGWTLLLPSLFGGSWALPLAVGGGLRGIIAGFPPHGPSSPLLRRLRLAWLRLACEGGRCPPSWSKT